MKRLVVLSIAMLALFGKMAFAVENISVDKIEMYTDKSKIPYIGGDGWAIPSGTPVVVMRTNNSTYAGWKFVAYGDSRKEILSLWLSARALSKNTSCVVEDRGNYWVQCVGVSY